MKVLKLSLIVLGAVLLSFGLSSMSYAFHSGGAAECGGCHSMHSPAASGSYLLVGNDNSSTCLTCHEHAGDTGPSSYHISTAAADLSAGVPPKQLTPGGDFGWLRKDYSFVVRGTTTNEDGETHGHNIVAVDNGYAADSVNTQAPGGTYLASDLGCPSCHNPHGKWRRLSDGTVATTGAPIIGSGSYDTSLTPAAGEAVGVYRLLDEIEGVKPPIAVVPATYNRAESSTQTRVAYGHSSTQKWGAWCAACHTDMHSDSGYVHPIDETLGSEIATNYGQYVKSGDMSGSSATSFTSLVPFVENSADYTVLKSHAKNNDSVLNGPASSDRVACISCHRAHASGFEFGLRWNMEGEFITHSGQFPGTDTTPSYPQFARGRLGAETQKAYYDRAISKFATYQRVLCNKCHAQD
ncbi:MAG: cytochrome C [Candidatus Schekmanbacteria bacterium]|nr:cytochrome C [Candidatus Schekmanbacteria bacterium]